MPAICGHQASDIERDLFSLPCRFGGLGLYKPPAVAAEIDQAAINVTKPLVDLILRTADDANPPSFSSALDAQQQAARLNKQSWMAHNYEGESYDPEAKPSSTLFHSPFYALGRPTWRINMVNSPSSDQPRL